LEKILTDIESLTKERQLSVETVILILEMANIFDDSNRKESNAQLIHAQMRLKEIVSSSNQTIKNYLFFMQKKDLIRYYKETQLYIPTDKGMHFLKIYNMLASLLI
jgi:predicted transcriptional regulator